MPAKILIIDDETDLLEFVSMRLTASGYQVITADDGPQGLAVARSEKPELILLDIMIPGMDGFHVCRILKFDRAYQHIPILFMTARVSENDKALAKEVGADDFLEKPVQGDTLLAKIRQHLKEK